MVGKLPVLVDKEWGIASIMWSFGLHMVMRDQLKPQAKVARHVISFITICGVLPLLVVNRISAYEWLGVSFLFLLAYFVVLFKVIPDVVLKDRKISHVIANVIFILAGISFPLIITMSEWGGDLYNTFGSFYLVVLFLVMLLVGAAIEIGVLSFQQQSLQRARHECEEISAERNFLKAQINPHFIFNALNNLLGLIATRSEKASEAVVLLAALMRKTIVMSTVEKVPLQEELKYLETYTELQKLQRGRTDDVTIEFKMPIAVEEIYIEPLMLIAFVENAFKHGIITGMRSFVSVDISVKGSHLVMYVSNTKFHFPNTTHLTVNRENSTGVGMVNVRRRLQIGYPHRHKVNISDGYEQYIVRVDIDL